MNCETDEKDQWLDQIISQSINTQKPEFDSEQWKQRYAEDLRVLTSPETKRPSLTLPGRHNVWRTIGRSRIARFAAAAVVFIVIGWGVVGILQNGSQTAYALEQTIEALQGKWSMHVRTWLPGDRLKEEFWAEFDESGNTLRFYQEEPCQLTVWENNVKKRLYPDIGVLLIQKSNGQENVLERTDPEFMVQNLQEREAEGRATIEIREPSADQPQITVIATFGSDPAEAEWQDVLLVDPDTKLVSRVDHYRLKDDDMKLFYSVEVVEYNQPVDPDRYILDLPEDVIVFDQVNQDVGMVQGDLSLEALAAELVFQALEAWKAEDYAEAGRLLGGAPAEFVAERLQPFKPVGTISIGQAVVIEHWRSGLDVPCEYEVERDGQIQMVERTWRVLGEPGWQKVDDQPDRWWVDVRWLGQGRERVQGQAVGLPQGDLSDLEIAAKVVREWAEALKAKDYAKVGQLVGGVSADDIRLRYDHVRIVRIISIGEPELHEDESDHFRVSFKIEIEADGKKEIVEEALSVEPVEGQPGRWEIDG